MPNAAASFPSDSPIARLLRKGFPSLRFEPVLEREFWLSHNAVSRPRVRLAVFLALATTLLFTLPFATTSAPECYSFGAVGPEFLETWTRVIAALAELAKVGWHIAECASSPRAADSA